jgi:hypothetical protein
MDLLSWTLYHGFISVFLCILDLCVYSALSNLLWHQNLTMLVLRRLTWVLLFVILGIHYDRGGHPGMDAAAMLRYAVAMLRYNHVSDNSAAHLRNTVGLLRFCRVLQSVQSDCCVFAE